MFGPYFPYALLVAALALSLPALLAILSAPGAVRRHGGIDPASTSAPLARARHHYPGRILIASPFHRDVLLDDEDEDE